jgi:hypothetical protein
LLLRLLLFLLAEQAFHDLLQRIGLRLLAGGSLLGVGLLLLLFSLSRKTAQDALQSTLLS